MGKQRRHRGNAKRRAREQAKAKTISKFPDTKALAWELVHRGLCSVHIIEESAR
jgi:hypothetical protein